METYKLYTEEDREAVRVVAEHRQRLRQEEARQIRMRAEAAPAHREDYVALEDQEDVYMDDGFEERKAWVERAINVMRRVLPAAVFALGVWEGLMDPWFALVCSVPYLAAGVWAALRG